MQTKIVNWTKKDLITGARESMQTSIEMPGFFQGVYSGRPVEFVHDPEIINKHLPSAFGDKEEVLDPPQVSIVYLDADRLITEGSEKTGVEVDVVPLSAITDIVQLYR